MKQNVMKRDKQIIRIATDFRKGILGKRSSHNMCFAVSGALEGYLNAVGIPATLTKCDIGDTEHWFLTLSDGNILDPTADQFTDTDDNPMPPVYYGVRPEWYVIQNEKNSCLLV